MKMRPANPACRIYLILVMLSLVLSYAGVAESAARGGFNGVTLGMPAEMAISNGFERCVTSGTITEKSCYADSSTVKGRSSAMNLKVDGMEIGIRKGKVAIIVLTVKDTDDAKLLNSIKKTYGKNLEQVSETSPGRFIWSRQGESITVTKESGQTYIRLINDDLLI